MCGIIGYIGDRNAIQVGLGGLKRLEYRGYDSAGIAFLDSENKNIFSIKAKGKLENLFTKTDTRLSSSISISHTRWCTHGGISEENAHPHTDCRQNIWLVHNGIIENYKELKDSLVKKGHRFVSETDTEVAVHLIEETQKQMPDEKFESVVRAAIQKIKGAYSFVIINKDEPEKIFAVRNFSPLVLGIGEKECFISSDVSAILKYTKDMIYLDDGEMAILTKEGYEITDFANNIIQRNPTPVNWTVEEAQKSGFKHFMLKEIFEQPNSILNSIRGRLIIEGGTSKLGGLEEVKDKLKNKNKLFIVACGTAYLAGCVGKYMLEEYAGISVEVDLASEFRYRKHNFREEDALLVISQSGETADTLAALREAKRKGVLTLGIVNVVGSSISRETDAGIYQHIGPEISVASTKAFTSQVAILALLTLFLGRQREMSVITGQKIAKELNCILEKIESILDKNEEIRNLAKKYLQHNNFLYLGRKYNFPTALEGALKIKEISYVHAEGCSSGEMKHGPLAMIDENFPSIFIALKDSVYEKTISNMQEIKARNGPIIAVATDGDSRISEIADDVIFIPETSEILSPILATIPLQLFAYHFGDLKGLDIDRPRNLAKSVTVE